MKPLVICHRGVNRQEENSLTSLLEVNNLSHPDYRFGIEFDVQFLPNGEIICSHDSDLKRTHEIDKKVVELTREEITIYKIPKLEEILEGLNGDSHTFVDIEVKIYDTLPTISNIRELKKLVEKQKNKKLEFIVTSFDSLFIEQCLKEELPVGFITYDEYDRNFIDGLIKKGLSYLIVWKSLFREQFSLFGQRVRMLSYTLFEKDHKLSSQDQDRDLTRMMLENQVGVITDSYKEVLSFDEDTTVTG